MPRRPPQWSINATKKRIEFDDSKFTNALFRNYGDADLCSVFGVLSKNANVENIKVQGCKVGDEGSRAMREGLSDNCSVLDLMFCDSVLGPKKFKRILQGMAANEELEITDLTFTNCSLDDRAIRYFDEVLISPLPDNFMICKSLSVINLENNKIGDRGAAALAYLLGSDSLLSKLLLNRNRIGDKGAKALAEKLKGNRMLHTLALGYNLVGVDGGVALAKGIEKNIHLVCLELQSNAIGAAGALEFGRVLDKAVVEKTGKKGLSTLNLSCNNIGDVGGVVMQSLAEQKIVGNLIINGNQVGVCNCKNCVLVGETDPSHWCYDVGKFDVTVLDIDDNGGNLTASNNTLDDGGLKKTELVARVVKGDLPKKIGYKPPRPKIDEFGQRIIDDDPNSIRNLMKRNKAEIYEQRLEEIMGGIKDGGKMSVGAKGKRDGGDGGTGTSGVDGVDGVDGEDEEEEGRVLGEGRRGAKLKGEGVYKGVGAGMLAGIEVEDNASSGDSSSSSSGDSGLRSRSDSEEEKGWWEFEEGGGIEGGEKEKGIGDRVKTTLSPNRLTKSRGGSRGDVEGVDGGVVEAIKNETNLDTRTSSRESRRNSRQQQPQDSSDVPPPPKPKRKSVIDAKKKRFSVAELLEISKQADMVPVKMKDALGDLLTDRKKKNTRER
ncbi:hypothetical protein TrLO_g13275 [Triparma laevis f. longispina]|uniref:Uncharacterized protein n=1 Tax=Triparma laevis f. longispina TaxID=1714387 RepID=A0A9W7AMQ5_9STRA|nr:hypothetical protein TrLO_g13275 [Triparma laevis f. longispina]